MALESQSGGRYPAGAAWRTTGASQSLRCWRVWRLVKGGLRQGRAWKGRDSARWPGIAESSPTPPSVMSTPRAACSLPRPEGAAAGDAGRRLQVMGADMPARAGIKRSTVAVGPVRRALPCDEWRDEKRAPERSSLDRLRDASYFVVAALTSALPSALTSAVLVLASALSAPASIFALATLAFDLTA